MAYVPQPYAPMLYAASDSTIGRGTAARSVVMTDWNSASVLQVGMLPGLEHDTLHACSRAPVCMPDPACGRVPLQPLEQNKLKTNPRLLACLTGSELIDATQGCRHTVTLQRDSALFE